MYKNIKRGREEGIEREGEKSYLVGLTHSEFHLDTYLNSHLTSPMFLSNRHAQPPSSIHIRIFYERVRMQK